MVAAQAASREELEARQAAVRTSEADLAAAQATVRAQGLTLGFTTVTAPISGIVSERRVDVGNAVLGDQTVLTTIVSTTPIHFAFDASEALLLKYQRQSAGAASGTPVRIRLQDEADYQHRGRLDFVDTRLNGSAGTVRARAVVENPSGFLKPGMFGHLLLAGSDPYQAVLIPDSAVVTDAARKVVYVVGAQDTVVARPVVPGPLSSGLRVIRSGLGPQDRVIVNGVQRARPGQKVQPTLSRITPAAQPAIRAATNAAPSSLATPAPASPASR